MKKEHLQSLLKELDTSIKIDLVVDDEPSNIKDELLKKHSKWVYQHCDSLLDTDLEFVDFNDLQKKLGSIWNLIQGTMLSYTAIPEAPVTHFLIKVAYEALRTDSKPPSLMQVIRLLMPSLLLGEDIDSLFTPSDCGCAIPGVKVSGLEFHQNETNPESTVIQFLKSHLIADEGEYLIPLWLLNKKGRANDGSSEKIDNVYYQYDQEYHAKNPTQLTPKECIRLGEHNPITETITEIHRRLKGYKEDSSNLLGQLTLLSKSLYFNSVYGIGREQESGSTAELSIRRFFDYYATLERDQLAMVLTPDFQLQLMKLRHCIGIYDPSEPLISPIETCLATRRQLLQDAMRGKEALLSNIGSSKTKLAQLIQADMELLKQQLTALYQAIEADKIEGHERLPITKRLIDNYKINLTVENIESLTQLIHGLSGSEIKELMTDDYAHNWSKAINNLENLVILFLQLSLEKTQALAQVLGGKLKEHYLKKGEDYISLLLLLSPEQQSILAKHLININDFLENRGSEEDLLFLVVKHSELFDAVWKLLSPEERLEAVKSTDKYGNTVLHHAINKPESFKTILELFPENERLEAVKKPNNNGKTVLYYATSNPESLKIILKLFPENERLKEVKRINNNGETVLHPAISNPESLKIILELFPENERLAAVKSTDKYGNTVLYYATSNPESLEIILQSLPKNVRLEAVTSRGENNATILDCTLLKPQTVKMILKLLPKNERLGAVTSPNNDGDTVLRAAVFNPESLKVILELLPEHQRLEAFKSTDKFGNTVLHSAVYTPKSIKGILESLPEEERLEAVKSTDKFGSTVLHIAVAHQNTDILEAILKSLPENQRLEAFKSTDKFGFTALHCAVEKAEHLTIIKKLLSENERIRLVYAIERPYLDFLYQHWEFITTEIMGALAAITAYFVFPSARAELMESTCNFISSLLPGNNSFFSLNRGDNSSNHFNETPEPSNGL